MDYYEVINTLDLDEVSIYNEDAGYNAFNRMIEDYDYEDDFGNPF